MADPKGDKLYVNLSASQTRKRLKGFGHGVRKVQSDGKNQAVIIHTATGQHLEELEAKFADVGCSAIESDLSEPIENLRNLGPASAAWLREIDVFTIADLERLGPVLAYRLVKQRHRSASLNLLWAMAAGLADKDWRELTDDEKQRLIGEVDKEGLARLRRASLANMIDYQIEPNLTTDKFIDVLVRSTLAERRPVLRQLCPLEA